MAENLFRHKRTFRRSDQDPNGVKRIKVPLRTSLAAYERVHPNSDSCACAKLGPKAWRFSAFHVKKYTKNCREPSSPRSAQHELQMTPAARLRRAARAICNRFCGCATVVRAISRQCAATRRVADGTFPGVYCGQPDRPLRFKASGTRARRTCGAVRRARGRSP